MDKSKDERARGVTIACTTREFFTESYHYTIIDAPGHRFVYLIIHLFMPCYQLLHPQQNLSSIFLEISV